ncbi:hypothetical protein FQN49_008445, partial [Arthroderma sp. PD_2]
MDHVLQLWPITFAKGHPRGFHIVIPSAIGELYVRGSSSQAKIEAGFARNNFGALSGHATMMAGDELLLSFREAVGFPVEGYGGTGASGTPLGSQIRWAPDIDLLSPSTLLSATPRPERYCEMIRDARQLSLIYILETADKLANITPGAPSLVKWKSWITAEASRLRQKPDMVSPESQDLVGMSSEARQTLINTISSRYGSEEDGYSIPFECMHHIYENCEEFSGDNGLSEETLNSLKRCWPVLQSQCDWSQFLTLLGHSNPAMRVLEIGAGTGSATRAALQHLKSPESAQLYSRYTFTDASESAIAAAEEMFLGDVETKMLDITKDPVEQGFELHSFDLIIASNVLHATPRLAESLQNVRHLLASNGRFLLHEMQPGSSFTSYIMGVLPDWWMGKEDGRLEQPCVSPEKWELELRAAGFVRNEAISYDLDLPNRTSFTLLSSVAHTPNNHKDVTLLAGGSPRPWAKEVACTLREQGYNVNWGTLTQAPPADQWIISLLDLDGPYLHNISEQGYTALHAFLTHINKSKMIWVTNMGQLACADPRFSLIFGLARTLRHELALDISTFETDIFDSTAVNAFLGVLKKLEWSREHSNADPEYEFSFYNGTVHTARCHWTSPRLQMPIQPTDETPWKLAIGSLGSVDTLHWAPFEQVKLKGNDVEVEMVYLGLNFRDIMVALGLFGDPEDFGIEGSGIIRRVGPDVAKCKPGDRVMVLAQGAFRTRVVKPEDMVLKIADELSLEDAATMPCVYFTAIMCLDMLARVKEGQSVLIHSACGGVGLAAINVCKYIGAQIFATVGSEEKVQHLINECGIPRHRIFNSRSVDFLSDVMRETN